MFKPAVLCVLLALASHRAAAGVCEAASATAESALGIPAGLLGAIGRVESGRRSQAGMTEAWPWSVNAAGEGYFLPTAEAAVALVDSLRARGIRSIDVGCFQVNLLYHPGAFADLAQAFDPAANATAAGAFLQTLRNALSGWEDAVAHYHSANPSLGVPYQRQVFASWAGGAAMKAPPVSQVAALVQVIVPRAFAGLIQSRANPRPVANMRLPVVITPSRSVL